MKRIAAVFSLLAVLALLPLWPLSSQAQDAVGPGRSLLEGFSRLGESLRGGSGERRFLPLEQAFPVSAEARGPGSVAVVFEVAEGYYLYRDKFRVEAAPEGVLVPGPPGIPEGEWKDDPEFGRVQINRGRIELLVPLIERPPEALSAALQVHYQGCAEDGICYPPADALVEVALPVATASGADASGSASVAAGSAPTPATRPEASARALAAGEVPVLSEQEAVTRLLSAGIDAATLAKFFGIGLLLAFTPCVFPMVPILSGILVGRGRSVTTAQTLGLSSAYVLAMALTYAGAGVLAGLFGQNLQAYAQNPYVLVVFAVLFSVLALSMFGLYSLQLPLAWQDRLTAFSRRQRGGSLLGAGLMGVASALVVGPCVAAPLAGTLAYIGLTGDAVFGGVVLFALALGMGTPLLLVGTSAGRLLPHAGPWMATVQKIFGVGLLAVAIWLLSRLLPGPAVLLLWALLLVVSAVYMGAFDPVDAVATGWQRLWKGVALALLTYGGTLIVGAAGGADDPLAPLAGWQTGRVEAASPLPFEPVADAADLDRRLAAARALGRPVMLDFYADWCVECKRMERTTFADASVRRRLEPVLLLKADVTAYDASDRALLARLGLHGPPATLFYGSDGEEVRTARLAGYVAPADFLAHLSRVYTP